MTESTYDSSIHHVTNQAEGRKPILWMRWTTLSGADVEVFTLEKVFITRETRHDNNGGLSQRITTDGGAVEDQVAAADWIVTQVAQDRQRFGIPQPGTQIFPDRIVFSSGIYIKEVTERGGE